MRQLTAQQKKLLTRILKDGQLAESGPCRLSDNPIKSVDDLTTEQWEQLQAINDTEILWQEVNCFISDWRMEQLDN